MTNEELKKGNFLLQNFMGWELINIKEDNDEHLDFWVFKNRETAELDSGYLDNGYDAIFYNKDSVKEFHKSWPILMSVVEKIETMNYGVKQCRKVVEIYVNSTKENLIHQKKSSRKKSLWYALVEFVIITN